MRRAHDEQPACEPRVREAERDNESDTE
jgi:hypothetical protein